MASRHPDAALQSLCRLAAARAAGLTDGQLLHRFAATRDADAFASLLGRYGGLVYRACLNVLRDPHDAEDAFQAAFIVLARRADAVREEKALGSWLYRVAHRVAVKARRSAARRRAREERTARPAEDGATCDLAWRELQAMLDEELDRLPDKYRTPFVLCCLENKSKSEAAAELGWKEGTVSSRLAHARELLRSRLARRGVTLSAVLGGLAVAGTGGTAAVPVPLAAAAREAALAFACGTAPAAGAAVPITLARSVLRGMAVTRAKTAVALLAVVGLVGSAAAVAFGPTPAPPSPPASAARPPEVAAVPGDRPDGLTMTVEGTVVGPDGRPVRGATVAVLAFPPQRGSEFPSTPFVTELLGAGRADDQGRFRVPATQTTPAHSRLCAVAGAPGFALSNALTDPNFITAGSHTLPIRLPRGQTVRGRLLDPAGRPAAGVRVEVAGLRREGPDGILTLNHEFPVAIPGWPEPATTDGKGEFALRDIGPDTRVTLRANGERFAPNWFQLRTADAERAEPLEFTLAPPPELEGRLTAADTGAPLSGAAVLVETTTAINLTGTVRGRTDSDGRFRLRPFVGKTYTLSVQPARGQPYLVVRQEIEWPPGAARHEVALAARRGVLVRGAVEEQGADRRLAGGTVRYVQYSLDNPFYTNEWWQVRDVRTAADGTFELAVPPGPGTLLVKAAGPDFVHVETSDNQLHGLGTGGRAYFPDAVVPLSVAPGGGVELPAVRLRRAVALRGRVVGHDGKPVAAAPLFSPTYLPDGVDMRGHAVLVRDGHFELPGCEPGGTAGVWVYDARTKTGAVAVLKVDPAAEPEVRLAPCTSAVVRVSDPDGRPVSGARLGIDLVFRTGDEINESRRSRTAVELSVMIARVCGTGYRPVETAAGEYLLPDLIPGATYTVGAEVENTWLGRVTFTAPAPGAARPATATIRQRPPTVPKK